MDKSASEITFDVHGVCNFCRSAERELDSIRGLNIHDIVKEIKQYAKNEKYDCLIGLSGGVDSSFALHTAVSFGLRPLCFSVDNGWNDPRADENIMRMVEALKVPFYRYTIDLAKFRDLQAAFMKAGVPNLEIPTDHILMATTYEMAAKNGIKYVISGGNVATESIMPASWGYNARDLVHIKDIFTRMTGKKLSGLPVCSLLKWNWYRWVKGIKLVYLLDYVDYNRNDAAATLALKYGWQEYGDKHCESVFTNWFQNFYLYEKFGFDKRKPHLSSMICSLQLTREAALEALGKDIIYPKLGFEQRVMQMYPKRSHDDFKKDRYDDIARVIRRIKSIWK
jgi:N-acetyl sugar amidotransferase